MSRIQKITISNFKAIKGQKSIDLKGASAIITAGNRKGKTSLLKGMIERIRFIRPDVIVNEGEESGKGELVLTTGEKFLWEFDINGKDKLTYVSENDIKQSVTKDLGRTFFPPTFDIDKFLESAPSDQSKQLQKIVGIDFTDIDKRYKIAYDDRTEKNRESEKYHVKLSQMIKCDKVERVDLTELTSRKEAERTRLNELYKSNKAHNDKLRKEWEEIKEKIVAEARAHNEAQAEINVKVIGCEDALTILKKHLYTGNEVREFIEKLKQQEKPLKKAETLFPPEPIYIQELPEDTILQGIDAEILKASETNAKADEYEKYINYKLQTEAAKITADEADQLVNEIANERQAMIESAKFPEGISISTDGITIDGLPLNKNQLSSSQIYITALRIASMNLGEVKTLYFDASTLDDDNLTDIEVWAEKQGLQLLIEQPVRGKGDKEITYELIEPTQK